MFGIIIRVAVFGIVCDTSVDHGIYAISNVKLLANHLAKGLVILAIGR